MKELKQEIKNVQAKITEYEKSLEENYTHSFSWGVPGSLFKANILLTNLQHVLTMYESNTGFDFIQKLKKVVSRIESNLLDNNLTQTSSNEFSNIAFKLNLEVQQKLRLLYNSFIEILS